MYNIDFNLKIDLVSWLQRSKKDPNKYQARQAIEIILTAVAMTKSLKNILYLKGGILMAIAYDSQRMTTDIDFTCKEHPFSSIAEKIKEDLDRGLKRATKELGYLIECRVQNIQERPRLWNDDKPQTHPALKVKIAYGKIISEQQRIKFMNGNWSSIIEIDISFNETISITQEISIENSEFSINAYSVYELIAEKIRAILQQNSNSKHPRSRKQDIYDIAYLIRKYSFDYYQKEKIISILFKKTKSHSDGNNIIIPNKSSLEDQFVVEKAKSEWDQMILELGENIPTFDECYQILLSFYKSLPWEKYQNSIP